MPKYLVHFVEIDQALKETNVGGTNASNYLRALVLFADKRYGKDGYKLKTVAGATYCLKNDESAVLESRPFPVKS